jgi:hypothetical protein
VPGPIWRASTAPKVAELTVVCDDTVVNASMHNSKASILMVIILV